MKLTEKGRSAVRKLGVVAVIVAGGVGLKMAADRGYGTRIFGSVTPDSVGNLEKGFLPSSASSAALLPLPGEQPADMAGKPEVRMLVWAWNSQMGCMYANGGARPTQGSLTQKYGVNLHFARQDDVAQMQTELVSFAKALKDGQAQPSTGAHYVAIMGDGSAAFLAGLNKQLEEAFGEEYRAEIIGSCGYSRGEDKLMGPQKWRDNPQTIRGGVIAGYLRDGDWNIAQRFLGDNGIPNNPDEKTYDPEAVNWISADSYVDAAQKYVSGYCEDRPVVRDGKRTGETKRICVEGIVTWTPADVTAARERGGIVSVVSTKEYSAQMPNVIIGIRKWNQDNRATVEGMLQAFFEGGDQVKAHPQALRRAAQASAAVYKEETPEYWEKYYRIQTERDKQGLMVELGGSSVNNLADNEILFGTAPGTSLETSRFQATYNVFGNIVKQQYPELVPDFPPVERIVDVSYIRGVASRSTAKTTAEVTTYEEKAAPVTEVIGRRNYAITFNTGQATFTPDAEKALEELFNNLSINSLRVDLHGHTDNVGDPAANQQLSEDRALAVKQWLERRSAATFPAGRVKVYAHGATEPVESNRTAEGRAKNRRVEVVIGN